MSHWKGNRSGVYEQIDRASKPPILAALACCCRPACALELFFEAPFFAINVRKVAVIETYYPACVAANAPEINLVMK